VTRYITVGRGQARGGVGFREAQKPGSSARVAQLRGKTNPESKRTLFRLLHARDGKIAAVFCTQTQIFYVFGLEIINSVLGFDFWGGERYCQMWKIKRAPIKRLAGFQTWVKRSGT
jgi:hypothetical protein